MPNSSPKEAVYDDLATDVATAIRDYCSRHGAESTLELLADGWNAYVIQMQDEDRLPSHIEAALTIAGHSATVKSREWLS